MKKTLHLLALLLGPLATARAEVLIYKGPGNVRTVPGTGLPPNVDAFVVFDIASSEYASTLFFKTAGQKRQVVGAPANIDMTTAPINGGGSARIILLSQSGAAPNFFHTILYFRGTQKSILVADSVARITRNEPRVFTALSLSGSESSGSGSFAELRLRLAFDEARTIDANNAGKSLQEALDALVADLTDKGFTPP